VGAYKIIFSRSAEKDLSDLPRAILQRVLRRIEALSSNPFPPGAIKLRGADQIYRIRIGDYRALYEVNRERREVTIRYVRHRREVYRKLR
jgi:mRNA interferase RelE/StbE